MCRLTLYQKRVSGIFLGAKAAVRVADNLATICEQNV
jgi:hypothetical protein